jgi:hypothetical protein
VGRLWHGFSVGVLFAASATGRASAQGGAPLASARDGTLAPHTMPKLGGGIEGFNIDLAAGWAATAAPAQPPPRRRT